MDFKPYHCFDKRMRSLARKMDRIYRGALEGTNTTESQLSILLLLLHVPGIEQRKIVEKLNLEKSTISRNLGLMERRSWLEKKGSSRDPQIFLTPKGGRHAKVIHQKWLEAMHETYSILGQNGVRALETLEALL